MQNSFIDSEGLSFFKIEASILQDYKRFKPLKKKSMPGSNCDSKEPATHMRAEMREGKRSKEDSNPGERTMEDGEKEGIAIAV